MSRVLTYALVANGVTVLAFVTFACIVLPPKRNPAAGTALPPLWWFWILTGCFVHSAVASTLAVWWRGGWEAWTLLAIHAVAVLSPVVTAYVSREDTSGRAAREARRQAELRHKLYRVSCGDQVAILRHEPVGTWTLARGTLADWLFTHIPLDEPLRLPTGRVAHPDKAVIAELCAGDGRSAAAGLSRLRRLESRRRLAVWVLERDAGAALEADLMAPTPEGLPPGGDLRYVVEHVLQLARTPGVDANRLLAREAGRIGDREFRRAIARAELSPEWAEKVAAAELADAAAGRLHEVFAPLAGRLPVARVLDALSSVVLNGACHPDEQRSEILTALLARTDLRPDDAELILSRMPVFDVSSTRIQWTGENSPLLALLGKARVESLLQAFGSGSHWNYRLLERIARWEGLGPEDADRVAAATSNVKDGRERALLLRALVGKASRQAVEAALETIPNPADRAIVFPPDA